MKRLLFAIVVIIAFSAVCDARSSLLWHQPAFACPADTEFDKDNSNVLITANETQKIYHNTGYVFPIRTTPPYYTIETEVYFVKYDCKRIVNSVYEFYYDTSSQGISVQQIRGAHYRLDGSYIRGTGGNVNMPTTKLDKYKALYWVGVSAFAKKMGKEEAVKYFGTMPN